MAGWKRPYSIQFAVGMSLYVVAMLVYSFAFGRERDIATIMEYLIALLPTVAMLIAMQATVMNVRSMDELEQRIQLEAVVITLLLVGALTFGYGLFESAELAPKLPLYLVLPLIIALWGITSAIVRRRFA